MTRVPDHAVLVTQGRPVVPWVGPVATTGENLEGDLAAVATAPEDLVEATAEARRKLNNLKIEAQSFHREHSDKDVRWLGHGRHRSDHRHLQ